MKRRLGWIIASLCGIAISGCYQKESLDGGLAFSFQPWVPLLVALAGIVALPVGIVLFNKQHRFWGVLLVVVGPLVAAGVAPGLYLDRVVVDDKGFYSRHGFWWNPTIHEIKYQDLNQVQVVVEEKIGRRGRKKHSYFFDCFFKSGRKERVPLGDIMREALPEIAEQFHNHGVHLQIPPNLH